MATRYCLVPVSVAQDPDFSNATGIKTGKAATLNYQEHASNGFGRTRSKWDSGAEAWVTDSNFTGKTWSANTMVMVDSVDHKKDKLWEIYTDSALGNGTRCTSWTLIDNHEFPGQSFTDNNGNQFYKYSCDDGA